MKTCRFACIFPAAAHQIRFSSRRAACYASRGKRFEFNSTGRRSKQRMFLCFVICKWQGSIKQLNDSSAAFAVRREWVAFRPVEQQAINKQSLPVRPFCNQILAEGWYKLTSRQRLKIKWKVSRPSAKRLFIAQGISVTGRSNKHLLPSTARVKPPMVRRHRHSTTTLLTPCRSSVTIRGPGLTNNNGGRRYFVGFYRLRRWPTR